MERPDNGLPEDIREHMRLMCDIIALAFQTDKTRVATLLLCRDLSGLYLSVPRRARRPTTRASHDDLSDAYERISRYHVSQLAYLARSSTPCPRATAPCSTTRCLMFLSNMWSGSKHDNMKVPVVLVGGLGGTLETGRVARLPARRRRQPQAVQPVPVDHGPHGREARPLRRCRDALGGVVI